jgi:hypothetical protein
MSDRPTSVGADPEHMLARMDRMNAEERKALVTLVNSIAPPGNSEDTHTDRTGPRKDNQPARD